MRGKRVFIVFDTFALRASLKVNQSQLPVVIVHRSLLIVIVVHIIRRTNLTETSAITLAGVCRFEFRLLSGRNKMRVFLQILDDFFADNLTLKPAQCALD